MKKDGFAAHRRWHATLAAVVIAWLVTAAAVNSAALDPNALPVSHWVRVHTLTIGAITTAIVGYSAHFTATLTRGPQPSYVQLGTEIAIIQASLVWFLFHPVWTAASSVIAAAVAVVIAWHVRTLARMIRRAFTNHLAVTSWAYVVAGCLLIAAVSLAVWAQYADDHDAFIHAHSRAAVWGFAWTAVLGTSLTLLPTLTGGHVNVRARNRCPQALVVHGAAVAFTSVCLAAGRPRLAGALLLVSAASCASLMLPTIADVFRRLAPPNAPALLLTCGMAWLYLCLVGDAASLVAGHLPPSLTVGITVALLGAGLAQTLLGAVSHLVPVLTGHPAAREHVARNSIVRIVLINAGGSAAIAGFPVAGGVAIAVGSLWHIARLGISLQKASYKA